MTAECRSARLITWLDGANTRRIASRSVRGSMQNSVGMSKCKEHFIRSSVSIMAALQISPGFDWRGSARRIASYLNQKYVSFSSCMFVSYCHAWSREGSRLWTACGECCRAVKPLRCILKFGPQKAKVLDGGEDCRYMLLFLICPSAPDAPCQRSEREIPYARYRYEFSAFGERK